MSGLVKEAKIALAGCLDLPVQGDLSERKDRYTKMNMIQHVDEDGKISYIEMGIVSRRDTPRRAKRRAEHLKRNLDAIEEETKKFQEFDEEILHRPFTI